MRQRHPDKEDTSVPDNTHIVYLLPEERPIPDEVVISKCAAIVPDGTTVDRILFLGHHPLRQDNANPAYHRLASYLFLTSRWGGYEGWERFGKNTSRLQRDKWQENT